MPPRLPRLGLPSDDIAGMHIVPSLFWVLTDDCRMRTGDTTLKRQKGISGLLKGSLSVLSNFTILAKPTKQKSVMKGYSEISFDLILMYTDL